MVRISIPTLPTNLLPSYSRTITSLDLAVPVLEAFLKDRRVCVLTGAGVSVESGIRAYRGKEGRYMNPNYQPILYQELVAPSVTGQKFRQRYWARSYLGYPPVRDARPNISHFSLATLYNHGFISSLITQNVDGLHARTGFPSESLLELHGTLFTVKCSRGHSIDRNEFQTMLSTSNIGWKEFVDDLNKRGESLRTNPDGDVELAGKSYEDFVVPPCPACLKEGRKETNLKPDVVFFGESVPEWKKQRSIKNVEEAERLLVVGTTMATYSAYRLVQLAHQQSKPILLLNIGPTRADPLGIEKLEVGCGEALGTVTDVLCGSIGGKDGIEEKNI